MLNCLSTKRLWQRYLSWIEYTEHNKEVRDAASIQQELFLCVVTAKISTGDCGTVGRTVKWQSPDSKWQSSVL